MILSKYYYRCKNCDSKFKALDIHEGAYAEFILRNGKGDQLRHLNAIDDSSYDEVAQILECCEHVSTLSENQQSDLLQHIFGVACDPANDGSEFQIDNKPKCPSCDSVNTILCGPTNPVETEEIDILPVEHTIWNQITTLEKKKKVELVVHQALSESNFRV